MSNARATIIEASNACLHLIVLHREEGRGEKEDENINHQRRKRERLRENMVKEEKKEGHCPRQSKRKSET